MLHRWRRLTCGLRAYPALPPPPPPGQPGVSSRGFSSSSSSSSSSQPRSVPPRSPLATAALVAFPLATAGLGTWQLQRREDKIAALAATSEKLARPPMDIHDLPDVPAEAMHLRVRLQGWFGRPDRPPTDARPPPGALSVSPRVRTVDGTAVVGALSVAPFYLSKPDAPGEPSGAAVLVVRGWHPLLRGAPDAADNPAASVAWPAGPVCLEGVVRPSETPPSGGLGASNDVVRGQWTWLDGPALAVAAGLPSDAPLVELTLPAESTAPRRRTPVQNLRLAKEASDNRAERRRCAPGGASPSTLPWPLARHPTELVTSVVTPDGHLTYALTWFSLSALTGGMAARLLRPGRAVRMGVGGRGGEGRTGAARARERAPGGVETLVDGR